MELKQISYNIINRVLDKNIRILYEDHNSLFDKIFNSLDYYIVNKTNRLSGSFYYDMQIINNYFQYLNNRNNFIYENQFSDIVLFHENPHNSFKKEDKLILANNLRTTEKVMLLNSFNQAWNLPNSSLVQYGIPTQEKILDYSSRPKDVLVLNLKNNNQIANLYQHIKGKFEKTDTINSFAKESLEEAQEILQNYKIVIDVDTPVNCLCATACGCTTITNQSFDNRLESTVAVEDFRAVFIVIEKILANNMEPVIARDIELIKMAYNYDVFKSKIDEIIRKVKSETFVI